MAISSQFQSTRGLRNPRMRRQVRAEHRREIDFLMRIACAIRLSQRLISTGICYSTETYLEAWHRLSGSQRWRAGLSQCVFWPLGSFVPGFFSDRLTMQRATEISYASFAHHLHTNTIGPIITAQRLLATGLPIGTIVFMSSDSGSALNFRDFEDGFGAYAASKAALNQMLRVCVCLLAWSSHRGF